MKHENKIEINSEEIESFFFFRVRQRTRANRKDLCRKHSIFFRTSDKKKKLFQSVGCGTSEGNMAEALSVECPQDGQTSQMTHPSVRIREFLKKQQHRRAPPSSDSRGADTDSGNSGDEQQRAQDSQSPPPNCSICLGRVKSKCFTDSCMHQFCFSCLLEWSKVRFVHATVVCCDVNLFQHVRVSL